MVKMDFGKHTKSIIKKLPYWFSMRKKAKDSVGAKFLNVFGLELDEVEDMLDYAYNQAYLASTSTEMVDILYKGYLPANANYNDVKMVKTSMVALTEAESLNNLIYSEKDLNKNRLVHSQPVYFYDFERSIYYVNQPYDKSSEYKNGVIVLVMSDGDNYEIPLHVHHVWNYLDEFGLLLWCPRLFNEDNHSYKIRLLDVFRNPAGSHAEGLMNGIARELNLRKKVLWENPSSTRLVLKDKMIILNKIKVNEEIVDIKDIYLNNFGDVVLLENEKYNKTTVVEYVSGLEMHRLNNQDDLKLMGEIYNGDGTPSELYYHYKATLTQISPVLWDEFVWDAAYYDMCDLSIGGETCITNKSDGDISGFRCFKK